MTSNLLHRICKASEIKKSRRVRDRTYSTQVEVHARSMDGPVFSFLGCSMILSTGSQRYAKSSHETGIHGHHFPTGYQSLEVATLPHCDRYRAFTTNAARRMMKIPWPHGH